MSRDHESRRTRRPPLRKDRLARRLAPPALLGLFAVFGCQQAETRFDVLSFRNAGAPELFTEHFNPGCYSLDATSDWNIVFELPPTLIDVPTASQPATGATTSAADPGNVDESLLPEPQEIWMAQYVHIHVFWQARPGTTYAESSQTNASIQYCLVTSDNAISYEGAGFVFIRRSRDGKSIVGQIESATLVPVRTVKEPLDLFGPCQLRGAFVAHEDSRQVATVLRTLRKKLGSPAVSPIGSSPGLPIDAE